MKGFALKLFLVLMMFVGVSQNAVCDPVLAIRTNIPTNENVSCSGKYYASVTLDNGTIVIYRGSFTLHVYESDVTLTVSDYPKPFTYVSSNWQFGLLDILCVAFPNAKKVYIETTSDYKKESK